MAKNGSAPSGVNGPPPPPGDRDDAGRPRRRASSKTLFQPPSRPASLPPLRADGATEQALEKRTTLMLGPRVPPRPSPLPDELITSRFPSLARLEAEWAQEEIVAEGAGQDEAGTGKAEAGVPMGIPSDDDSAMFKTAPSPRTRSATPSPTHSEVRDPVQGVVAAQRQVRSARRPTPMPGAAHPGESDTPAWVAPNDAPPSSVPTAPHQALTGGGFDPEADSDFEFETTGNVPELPSEATDRRPPPNSTPTASPASGSERAVRRTRRLATVAGVTLVAAMASIGVLVFTPQGKAFVASFSEAPAAAGEQADTDQGKDAEGEAEPREEAAGDVPSSEDQAASDEDAMLAAATPTPAPDVRAEALADPPVGEAGAIEDPEPGEASEEASGETGEPAAAPPEQAEPEPEAVPPKPEPEPEPEPVPSEPETEPATGGSNFGDPKAIDAYVAAAATFEKDPSNDNRKALALAACRIPDGPKAREAFRKLKGRDERREVTDTCMALKVHILAKAKGYTRKELLQHAEWALSNGNHQLAYDKAKESYQKKRSNAAMLVMGKAACGLGDDKALKRIRPRVPRSLRPELDATCDELKK